MAASGCLIEVSTSHTQGHRFAFIIIDLVTQAPNPKVSSFLLELKPESLSYLEGLVCLPVFRASVSPYHASPQVSLRVHRAQPCLQDLCLDILSNWEAPPTGISHDSEPTAHDPIRGN